MRLVICARSKHHFDGVDIPANVEIIQADQKTFDELLAGSRMVVIALKPGKIHSGGHTVVVNTLTLGKPLVIAEDGSLKNYVIPGVDALMVPSGDTAKLRNAITSIIDNAELYRRLSENALISAEKYKAEAFFSRVFALADELCAAQKR